MSDIIKKDNTLLSTTELAKILNCNNNTVTENAKSIFPNKVFITYMGIMSISIGDSRFF